MEISAVRSRFQKKVDFFIPAKYTGNVFHKSYSLQQDPLTSDKFLLYITSSSNPTIDGLMMFIHNQPWLVYKHFLERSNKNMFEYQLMPANERVGIKALITRENALGDVTDGLSTDGNTTLVDGNVDLIFDNDFHCYLDSFDRKERVQPTAQAVDAFEQTFILAQAQLQDYQAPFTIYYKGNAYKVMSSTNDYGVIKIRATQDL